MNVCGSAIISLDEKHIHLMENLKRAALLVSRLQQCTTHCNVVELTDGKHNIELVLGWAKFDMKKKNYMKMEVLARDHHLIHK